MKKSKALDMDAILSKQFPEKNVKRQRESYHPEEDDKTSPGVARRNFPD